MNDKIKWMLQETIEDGFVDVDESKILQILSETYTGSNDALVDYVMELNYEYISK